MKNLTSMTAAVALTIALAACSNENEITASQDGRTELNVTAGIKTRAADAQWQANDAIGLVLFQEGTVTPYDNKFNYRYITSDGNGIFSAATDADKAYLPSVGFNADLLAYYPYTSQVIDKLKVPVDVSSQASLPAIDLMAADKVGGLNANNNSASLTFSHKLCKLVFRVAKDETTTSADLTGATAVLKGTNTKASWDIIPSALSVSSAPADIALPMTADGTGATAIILPASAGAGKSITLTTRSGDVYNAPLSETLILRAGTVNTFTMTLHRHEASITASVTPWTTGVETGDQSLLDVISGGSNITLPAGTNGKFYLSTADGDKDVTVNYTWNGTTLTTGQTIYWEQLAQTAHTFNALFIPDVARIGGQDKDYLAATAKDVAFGKAVNLTLTHAMAHFIVKLSSDGTYTADELKAASITFLSSLAAYDNPGTATLSYQRWADNPTSMGNAYAPVNMTNASATADATGTFSAIICPQTISGLTLTIAGKTFTLTKDMALTAGQTYTLNAAVGKTTIKAGDIAVADWAVGTTADGTFQY